MYKYVRSFILATLVMCIASLSTMTTSAQAQPAPTTVKALILYDNPPRTAFEKMGFGYAIMLKNLLGHFDGQVDLLPVQNYTNQLASTSTTYSTVFYLGAAYDNSLPPAFLRDVMANADATTPKTLVWFNYNLWKLAWNADNSQNLAFNSTFGFSFSGIVGYTNGAAPSAANPKPGFYDTVRYKSMEMVKFYEYDSASNIVLADPFTGATTIVDATKAESTIPIINSVSKQQLPYVVRAGKAKHFWYFADMPFSYIGPRDRYLVLTDLLHDIVGINHAENHQAMVRLEDVSAIVDAKAMRTLTTYLRNSQIPFAVATIPFYRDPLGAYNNGVAQTIRLGDAAARTLRTELNFALANGGEIVMHGYTHQYSNVLNRHTAVSGDDYEFWDIVNNKPVAEDSQAWASGRLTNGLNMLRNNGYNPFAWEAPHYHSSPKSMKAVPPLFSTTYQRAVYFTSDTPNLTATVSKDFGVGQFYPYVIKKDYYNQRVLPENLGNIEYIIEGDPASTYNYTADDLLTNAKYALTVRDGVASFFFHPFWLETEVNKPGFADFDATVKGIKALGFTFVRPSQVK